MRYWILRIGIVLIAIGVILLSPIADLLPINFWGEVKSLFSSDSAKASNYYRLVPTTSNQLTDFSFIESGQLIGVTILGLGLILFTIGLLLRPKKMRSY
jgi:hypothetical protein